MERLQVLCFFSFLLVLLVLFFLVIILWFLSVWILYSMISLLLQKKLHKFELACLANLCPETAEESKALIPRSVPAELSSVCWVDSYKVELVLSKQCVPLKSGQIPSPLNGVPFLTGNENDGFLAHQLLAKLWNSWMFHTLKIGVQISTVPLENNLATSSKVKDDITLWPKSPLVGTCPKSSSYSSWGCMFSDALTAMLVVTELDGLSVNEDMNK